jgi:hypothetical protein
MMVAILTEKVMPPIAHVDHEVEIEEVAEAVDVIIRTIMISIDPVIRCDIVMEVQQLELEEVQHAFIHKMFAMAVVEAAEHIQMTIT